MAGYEQYDHLAADGASSDNHPDLLPYPYDRKSTDEIVREGSNPNTNDTGFSRFESRQSDLMPASTDQILNKQRNSNNKMRY